MSAVRTTIALICTDNGQHQGWIVHSWLADPETVTAEALIPPVVPGSHIELECKRCRRRPRIRSMRWQNLCALLAARARSGERRVVVDVSKLGV